MGMSEWGKFTSKIKKRLRRQFEVVKKKLILQNIQRKKACIQNKIGYHNELSFRSLIVYNQRCSSIN